MRQELGDEPWLDDDPRAGKERGRLRVSLASEPEQGGGAAERLREIRHRRDPDAAGDEERTRDVEVEPTGADLTYWVTDAGGLAQAIENALGRDGVAGDLIAEAGGLKLFALMGFYQAGDERLARAPGRLTGVIGAAPAPIDV